MIFNSLEAWFDEGEMKRCEIDAMAERLYEAADSTMYPKSVRRRCEPATDQHPTELPLPLIACPRHVQQFYRKMARVALANVL